MNKERSDAVTTTMMVNGLKGERPVNEMDIAALSDLYGRLDDLRKSSDKLGVVLEEMVKQLDNGTGIDVYLLRYVVEARQSLRFAIDALEDHVGLADLPDGKSK